MEDITILMFIITLAVFLFRYFKRGDSLNYLTVLLSLMAMLCCFRDATLDSVSSMFVFFPMLFIFLTVLVSITSGERKRW